MVLATTIMTGLILLSFWWMVRPFADGQQVLLGMAVLLGCIFGPDIVTTIEGQIFYLMASYYAGYLITMFVVFGDYARSLTRVRGGGDTALSFVRASMLLYRNAKSTADRRDGPSAGRLRVSAPIMAVA